MGAFALIGLVVSILSFTRTRYKSRELAEIEKRWADSLGKVVQDVAVLKKQMDLFWGVVEKQMSARFHSPDHLDRDVLLDKVNSGKKLTHQEAEKLCGMLMEIIEKDAQARADATLFLASLTARYALDPVEVKANH